MRSCMGVGGCVGAPARIAGREVVLLTVLPPPAGCCSTLASSRCPKELLEKCERLTPGEFQLLKSHVEFGMEMLKDTVLPQCSPRSRT